MSLNDTLHRVTERVRERSRATRRAYLDQMDRAIGEGRNRDVLSSGNLDHGFAACGGADKRALFDKA